ncbi:MAG TPA: hypothetical protein VGA52_06435 [Anaerolineales bacterium]
MEPPSPSPNPSWAVKLSLRIVGLLIVAVVAVQALFNVDPASSRLEAAAPWLGVSAVLLFVSYLAELPAVARWRVSRLAGRGVLAPLGPTALRIERGVHLMTYVVIVLAAAAGRQLVAGYDPGNIFPDTIGYVRVAEQPLLSAGFLWGERPFTLPLLLKILGINLTNYKDTNVLSAFGRTQSWIGIVAWSVLAAGVALNIRQSMLKQLGFLLVMLVGLALHVSQWDSLLLSESLSASLIVLGIGLVLLWLRARERTEPTSPWTSRALLGLLAVTTFLYCFVRETNGVFVGILGAGLAIVALVRLARRRQARNLGLAAVLLLAFFLLQQAGMNASGRWLAPWVGMFQQRVLAQPAAHTFMVRTEGMPLGDWHRDLDVGMLRTEYYRALLQRDDARPFMEWMKRESRGAYARYLLAEPGQTLLEPVEHVGQLVNPVSTEYRSEGAATPGWLRLVTLLTFPTDPLVLAVLVLCAAAVSIAAWRRAGLGRHWWVVAGLIAMTAPMMYVIWYADTIEVERHAFELALRLRLALTMTVLWGVSNLNPRNEAGSQ